MIRSARCRRITLVALLLAIGVPGVASVADTAPDAVVPAGISIGHVAVGGLDRAGALAALAAAYLTAPIHVVGAAPGADVVRGDLGVTMPGAEGAVDAALAATAPADVSFAPAVDDVRLHAVAAAIAARARVAPTNARWLFGRRDARVVPDKAGSVILVGPLAAALRVAALDPAVRTIVASTRSLRPRVTADRLLPAVVIGRRSNTLRLYHVVGGRAVLWRAFRVATGMAGFATPLGTFHVVNKVRDPWWYPPASAWARGRLPAPPGPNNPLGTRWMGLSAPDVGIHGTPHPESIGHAASHGCIRMRIADAEWLFARVRVGSLVRIVGA